MKLSGIIHYMMPYYTSYFIFFPHDFGVSQSKTRTLPLRHKGGGDPSLIRYSSKTAEQNFMKLSGIVHYMMPYCTSYFKFLSAWFWGFSEQNKDFAITTYGEGDPSLICYSSKTAEQNFMKLSGIVHYKMPYCTSYFKFNSNDFGVSQRQYF